MPAPGGDASGAPCSSGRHSLRSDIEDFHERLAQNGKKPVVAIIAATGKPITNAKLRDALRARPN